jgi:hypothetical protein
LYCLFEAPYRPIFCSINLLYEFYSYSQLDSLTQCKPCMHVFLLALLIVNWSPLRNANLMICSMYVNPCIDLRAHDKSRLRRQLTCNTSPKHNYVHGTTFRLYLTYCCFFATKEIRLC